MFRILLFTFLLIKIYAQKLPEDWSKKPVCIQIQQNLKSLTKEVHFSVKINQQHDVILELSHASFYDKIWTKPNMGVAVQLIPKSLYNCKDIKTKKTAFWMPTLFLNEMNSRKKIINNSIEINIGKVPLSYQNETLEGNISFLTNGNSCEFLYFIDLESANFSLLPMGFYTDVAQQKLEKNHESSVLLFKSIIPFKKNSTEFDYLDFEEIKKYLILNKSSITKIEINSFASVEGDFDLNTNLYQNRAKNILIAIKDLVKFDLLIENKASENWEGFYREIENTPFEYLKNKPQSEIKESLKNKEIQLKIETILQKTRNTSISVFTKNNDYASLINVFNESIKNNDTKRALEIQKTLFIDNKNPEQYLNKIEIPQKSIFADLLNSEIIFRSELKLIDDKKALQFFNDLIKKEPGNIKFNYNATVLALKIWDAEKEDKMAETNILPMIKNLQNLGLNAVLFDRLMINFHLIRSFYRNDIEDFKEKDKSIELILKKYKSLNLNDEDALALAKFLIYFDLKPAAFDLIESKYRQNQSEAIVFYYLNLLFFENSIQNQNEIIQKAANLNKKRFCKLFDSVNEGGASFQLLENPKIKAVYCEKCQ